MNGEFKIWGVCVVFPYFLMCVIVQNIKTVNKQTTYE